MGLLCSVATERKYARRFLFSFPFFQSFERNEERVGRADSAKRWGFTRGFMKYCKGIKDSHTKVKKEMLIKNVSKLDTLGLLSSGHSKQSVKLSNQGC